MQKQSARIKCKNNLFKSASDMMRLVKTTTYAQNNNIQCYFQILKELLSLSESISMNGIVVSEVF